MKKLILSLICLAAAWGAVAKVELPGASSAATWCSSKMPNAASGAGPIPVPRCGSRPRGVPECTVRSDADGRWSALVNTPAGSYEPQQVTIVSGERVVLDNVLIGEVWFAGGQSNMEMPLRGFNNCPIAGANEIIARAGSMRDRLRYVKIPLTAAYTPQDRVPGKWRPCTVETAPDFTATGYFFAELLSDVLDVPVGIVDCTWGGTRVEGWTNREILETYPDIDLTEKGIEATTHWLRPMVMYNAMLHPVAGYTVRGFLWYQGESNVNQYKDYAVRLSNMVGLWRSLWKQGDIPFYYVEVAPFAYGSGNGPYLREAQWKARELIPNSGVICTNDLVEPYEATNIHPKNKRDVGHRLAYMALNKTYGFSDIACESPRFRSIGIRDGKAYVALSHTEEGSAVWRISAGSRCAAPTGYSIRPMWRSTGGSCCWSSRRKRLPVRLPCGTGSATSCPATWPTSGGCRSCRSARTIFECRDTVTGNPPGGGFPVYLAGISFSTTSTHSGWRRIYWAMKGHWGIICSFLARRSSSTSCTSSAPMPCPSYFFRDFGVCQDNESLGFDVFDDGDVVAQVEFIALSSALSTSVCFFFP